MPSAARTFRFRVNEDSGCSFATRVRGSDAEYITQAAVSTITVKVRCLFPSGSSVTYELNPAEVVYDTLQVDDFWGDADEIGYNLRWDVSSSVFTKGGGRYSFRFLITPVTGAAFKTDPCFVDVEKDATE